MWKNGRGKAKLYYTHTFDGILGLGKYSFNPEYESESEIPLNSVYS